VYEYLTKSKAFISFFSKSEFLFSSGIQPTKNETLRRGMSIAVNCNEKPAPPIRRTPSMNTNCHQQQPLNNGYIELQSRLKARLKRAEEIAGQVNFIHTPQKTTTVTKLMSPTIVSQTHTNDDDFPPPPPDFLLNNNESKATTSSTNSTLLAEIQRGGFKLRKTAVDRDRSAPRFK
jgi:hypothetical protein